MWDYGELMDFDKAHCNVIWNEVDSRVRNKIFKNNPWTALSRRQNDDGK